ncbi:8946_t:CDS:2, partial [Paraglomus occultum]
AFIVNRNDIAKPANVMNSDEQSDAFWKPKVKYSYPWRVRYINDTVFVYGLYAPFHFSHWMFNGLLPLYSIMRSYKATRDAWLLRAHMVDHQRNRTIPEDISFLTDGKDIVFDSDDILTEMQVVPSSIPICFARAVVVKQDYTVKFLNFDVGCSLPATAKLLEDVDILITPHGNGLGDAIFMAPKTTVISIDTRFYSETWFAFIHTAAGRRFYNFQCDSSECQVADFEMAKKQLQKDGIEMSYHELMEYLGPEYPYRLIDKYYPGEDKWGYLRYAKDAIRRVNVEKLVKFVNEIVEEWPMVQSKPF